MKRNLLKKAYVSIEVIIVAAVVITAGLSGVLAFVKNGKNNNKTMLNAIDDVYTELEMPLGGGTGGSGGSGGIVIPEETLTPLTGEAYALVYDDADGKRTVEFIRSETPISDGDIYEGFTILKACTGFETEEYSSSMGTYQTPWGGYSIHRFVFKDEIRPLSTKGWFQMHQFCEYIDLTNLNTALTENMQEMFSYTGQRTNSLEIIGLNDLKTQNVKIMKNMFSNLGYYNITEFDVDFSGWDTSNVTDMSGMFSSTTPNATTWRIVGIEDWDVSNVTNMSRMFSFAGHNADYTIDLSNWKSMVGNVVEYEYFEDGVGDKIVSPWD